MNNISLDTKLFNTLLADTPDAILDVVVAFLKENDVEQYTIWKVTGNIMESSHFSNTEVDGIFDAIDLGYNHSDIYVSTPITLQYFGGIYDVYSSIFFMHNGKLVSAISFHTAPSEQVVNNLKAISAHVAKRLDEISHKSRQMDLYIDYQKKVDFIIQASVIFKAIDIDEVISVALSFFMDTFSADAVVAYGMGSFHGIGLDETDIRENIFIDGMSMKAFTDERNVTEFFENVATSSKFNIRNMFFVYEETNNVRFILFNTIMDSLPDKDFSSLVSGVVAIAIENAQNYEKLAQIKVAETEVSHTADILNRFVHRELSLAGDFDAFGVNYPARNVGGDFMFIIKHDEGFNFYIADVCGKGYSAAVLTVLLSLTSSRIRTVEDIQEKLENLNEFLINKDLNSRFITGCFGVVNTKENRISYISCGHEPVVVFDGDNTITLDSQYVPLGLMEETYMPTHVQLTSTDNMLLFAYTDGLLEYEPLDKLVKRVEELRGQTSKDITQSLYKTLVTSQEDQIDDFTCIIIKS